MQLIYMISAGIFSMGGVGGPAWFFTRKLVFVVILKTQPWSVFALAFLLQYPRPAPIQKREAVECFKRGAEHLELLVKTIYVFHCLSLSGTGPERSSKGAIVKRSLFLVCFLLDGNLKGI